MNQKQYEQQLSEFMQSKTKAIGMKELTNLLYIRKSHLYTAPPRSVEESYHFGWLRGVALETESLISGNWSAWLRACKNGEAAPSDIPESVVDVEGKSASLCYQMLSNCMSLLSPQGYRVTDLVDWIGFGLGISWFSKPRIKEDIWDKLYRTFNLDLFFLEPADYLSRFLAEYGQSGHLDYYPTPMDLTKLISKLVNSHDRTDSQIESCVGALAMLLPSAQINMVGIDLSYTMVKVSSIQAFLYKPWLLYVPTPIIGIHVDSESKTINRYYEFRTDTRIYRGDSLLGELTAPKNIFEENSKIVDVYLGAVDLSKREIYKYEKYIGADWHELSEELRFEIVQAFARELPFQIGTTNPPFNVKINSILRDKMNELSVSNAEFLSKRNAAIIERSEEVERITEEVTVKLAQSNELNVSEGQLQLVF